MITTLSLVLVVAASPQSAWDQRFGLEDDDARLRHATKYIAEHGDAGGSDRLLAAHAIAGSILWRRSCPVQGVLGACVSVQESDPHRYCFDQDRVLVHHRRHTKLARRARRHLDRAVALIEVAENESHPIERGAELNDAIVELKIVDAAAAFERALALAGPGTLQLTVQTWKKNSGLPKWERQYAEQVAARAASNRTLAAFMRTAAAEAAALVGRSHPVVGHARAGLVAFAARASVYADNGSPKRRKRSRPTRAQRLAQTERCGALASAVEPLVEQMVAAYGQCLTRATAGGLRIEASRWCEAELVRETPDRVVATHELVPMAHSVSHRLSRYGVQTTVDGEATVVTVNADDLSGATVTDGAVEHSP